MPELCVGRGEQVGPLSVFGVWASRPGPVGLVTGTAAQVTVVEREGSPVVGELVLTNTGPAAALLLEGELLEGGWQHRVLQHDVVLAAGSSLVAAVACVEAGRWHGTRGHVRRARRASGSVRAGLQAADPGRRQSEVWRRVARLDEAMGPSPTSSYVDHLDRLLQAPDVDGTPDASDGSAVPVRRWLAEARRVSPWEGQRGVLVGVAGQPMLLELFPSGEALVAALPELLTGMLLDAVAAGVLVESTPSRRARRVVAGLDGRDVPRARGLDAGAGDARVLDAENAAVRGVTMGRDWVHLAAFNRRHALLAAV